MSFYTELSHLIAHDFLSKMGLKAPYTVAVVGSVAVGKTLFSQTLQTLLQSWPSHPHVDVVSTDGYIYPYAVLKKRGLLEKKGFPETYDIVRLLAFLKDLKEGKSPLEVPIYSHDYKDILPNETQTLQRPDVVIIEGLPLLPFDFFDFSIYLDADIDLIKQWYLERFLSLWQQAKLDKEAYLYRFAHLSELEVLKIGENLWDTVNEPNLINNILPYREKASLVLGKDKEHHIVVRKMPPPLAGGGAEGGGGVP